MRFVPNALTLSRIPVALAVLLLSSQEAWLAAWICLVVGALTDALDGYLANRWNCRTSLGGQILEPVCDLLLTLGAMLGLWLAGVWSVWILVATGAMAAVFQMVAWFGSEELRQHQCYLHPLSYVGLLCAIVVEYSHQAFQPHGGATVLLNFTLVATLLAVTFIKRARIKEWLPPPTTK